MKISKLKEILQDALNTIEAVDPCDEVTQYNDLDLHCQSNTYFVNKANYFLGGSFGYLALDSAILATTIEDAIEDTKECEGDGDCDNCKICNFDYKRD